MSILDAIDKFSAAKPCGCQNCKSPVQWRPFGSVPWQCSECSPPPSTAVARNVRILDDDEPSGWKLLKENGKSLRERDKPPEDDVFESIPEWTGRDYHFLRDDKSGAGPKPTPDGPHCAWCKSEEFKDSSIHSGRSSRRDCAKCGKFHQFTTWNP